MKTVTITIMSIRLDIEYESSWFTDPLGTGDSPSEVVIEIESIKLLNESVDISSLLSDYVLNLIDNEVTRIEYLIK